MGTKANPGPCDCYAKAEPDEPIFVLLGRDKHAPALVWLWCVLREFDGEKPEVVAEARVNCAAMLQWAANHGRQSVGVGQSVLAGVLELIRTANFAVAKHAPNAPTGEDFLRLLLNYTNMNAQPVSAADVMPEPKENP